ncbi:MAG TPA: Fic family protein [Jatrophihabitans sp.]|uniref:type II toxin-antitoxin system death-on-curing family toxin n=1 Tax=Jatrophihabitans sp. TaxID=1932789 RepID=UPI002F20F918
MIVHLTFDDILALASDAVAPADVIVRDFGLLQSAVARTQASAFGRDAYPIVALKAAALMESLARNHALVDGNKRLAWLATMVFCLFNDMIVTAPSVAEGEQFVLAVCQGQLALDDIAHTLLRWS